jgi:LytS/YehU family sensor histidine kinase
MIILSIGLTAGLVAWRYNALRRREKEKTMLQQRVHELEQMALRSQMNPHFIFNCLNSIQHFIISNDLESTNLYLTEFAHLIRQTMDNAEKGSISISREIQYLSRYIELERMRFGKSFSFCIVADASIDKDFVHIPSMILQPYVENSIRHGIRYRTDELGMINIKFQQSAPGIVCIVEDNGIGRMKAGTLKSQVHVEYQSKGMSLTAERIQVLSRQYGEKVSIEIIDLTDELMKPSGTRIVISFPFNLLTKLA